MCILKVLRFLWDLAECQKRYGSSKHAQTQKDKRAKLQTEATWQICNTSAQHLAVA